MLSGWAFCTTARIDPLIPELLHQSLPSPMHCLAGPDEFREGFPVDIDFRYARTFYFTPRQRELQMARSTRAIAVVFRQGPAEDILPHRDEHNHVAFSRDIELGRRLGRSLARSAAWFSTTAGSVSAVLWN